MGKRTIICFCTVLIAFSILACRYIYILNDDTYTANINNSSKTLDVGTVRGTIFDCNSLPLTNTTYEYIAAVPPTAKGIKSIIKYGITKSQHSTLLSGYPVAVKVDENFNVDGIEVFKIPTRYSGLASHLIGYCNSENLGVCGIEQDYNDILKGKTIKVNFKTDANGSIISNSQSIENDTGYEGNGVMLTLDRQIQQICEDVAKKYIKKGAIVVLENSTGKIKGMASLPTYNPNNVENYIDSDSSPFLNRALLSYNCGSVFKLCTASAALEHNISIDYICKGYEKVKTNQFNCLKKHGKVGLAEAIAYSCNSFFVNLGQKVGANSLYSMAKNFGFGVACKLSDNIVSTSGVLPELTDLLNKPAELANFSFGQGELMTTPLQIASMIQCISNDGKLLKPTLIEGITDSKGKLVTSDITVNPTFVLSTKNALLLQRYMIKTIKNGTGVTAKPSNVGAGGKTATAQTGIYDKSGKAVYQTWFGGFFPEKNPKYTVVVLCENGNSGSKSAGPVFKEIVEQIYNLERSF